MIARKKSVFSGQSAIMLLLFIVMSIITLTPFLQHFLGLSSA